ncbi:MAG TPA: DUF2066 domain-containing protein [Pseudomonadales bacterium]|nr:DUF2066 domain-containing protein [Pseudomonadales bacterium]
MLAEAVPRRGPEAGSRVEPKAAPAGGAERWRARPRGGLRVCARAALLVALCACFAPLSAVHAAALDPLSVAVPVADQGASSRRAAEREGFEIVLVRLAGDDAVLALAPVRAALTTPQRYYSASSYARRPQAAAPPAGTSEPARPWLLRLEFDARSVFELLEAAGVPVWTGRRPDVLVWIARENVDGERRLLGAEDPVAVELQAQAERRGVPVLLPLLDLEDLGALSVGDVWARFEAPIERASARYPVDAWVTLRLYPDALGRWRADWSGVIAGEAIDGLGEMNAPADAARALIDDIAVRLADRFAVRSGAGASLWLQVDGIDAVGPYAALMRYLEAVHGVAEVQLVQVQGSSLLLRVDGVDTSERLLDLLRLEGRLQPEREPERAGGVAVWRARWRG